MKNIPAELKSHRQWVNWKSIDRGGRITKMPVMPNGSPASSTDPSTWSAFSELADNHSGSGFVFSQDDPYIGIDLDGCRNPETGKLDDWAREIVLTFGTYAEISPSETGVKLFGITDAVWTAKNKIELTGSGYGGKSPGIEVYDCGRYFAMTGKVLSGCRELSDVDDHLRWLIDKYEMAAAVFAVDGGDVPVETPIMERASRYLAKMEPSVAGQRGHDRCFKAACAMTLGFELSSDEAFHLLASEYNARCEPPWSERELRHKVNSSAKQPGQRGYLRDAQPSDWKKIFVRSGSAPDFEEPEAQKPDDTSGPRRTTLDQAVADYLQHLADGKEHLIETGIPELDHALGGGVAPGEMVIVAARPSHGKSAIALQMIHHATANGISAVMVSEEMSALAIGKRAIQFATSIPEEHWRTSREGVASEVEEHFSRRKPARIIESCGSVDRVVAEVEAAVTEMGAGIVVVDYVQLLTAKGQSRYDQVTLASQEMRRMASRLGVVVVVLAQLNRAIEDRKKFIPMCSDLKETGQLEQDADVIVFGVWPHRIDASQPAKNYQFYVGKNRNRAINASSFQVEFEPSRQRLVEESAKSMPNYSGEFSEYEHWQ